MMKFKMNKPKHKRMKKTAKRVAKKVVKKKKITTKTVAKVKEVPTVKKTPSVRISNFKFEPFTHTSFPEMVVITRAPKWANDIIGKRYVNAEFATKMITSLAAEKVINSGGVAVKKEVVALVGETLEETEFKPSTKLDYEPAE